MKQRQIELEFPKQAAHYVSLPALIEMLTTIKGVMVLAGVDPNESVIEGEFAICYEMELTEEEKENGPKEAGRTE
jgi:hypothetical protein